MTEPKRGVSRRTVVKGTAWAVPAVVVATAAPAMAAGASQCLTPSFGPNSCRYGQNGQNPDGYRLEICFRNTCTGAQTITVTRVKGDSTGSSQNVNVAITVQPNSTACLPNGVTYCSSASSISVYYKIGNGPEQSQSLPSPTKNCPGSNDPCSS